MKALGFGQPANGIIQMAYVVPDLAQAMTAFTDLLSAGPWFVLRSFNGVNARYQGEPALALCDIALGFAGHMQIELIQPIDQHPSVYRDAEGALLEGFHHFGVAATDFDAAVADMEARGYGLSFDAMVSSGGRVAYYDTRGSVPGMIELIEAGAALDDVFTAMHRASLDWDGGDAVRELQAG